MSTKFGPGFPGNTKASSATDTPLPSKPNEGDPCMNMPKDPIKTGNSHNAGTTAGVQSTSLVVHAEVGQRLTLLRLGSSHD